MKQIFLLLFIFFSFRSSGQEEKAPFDFERFDSTEYLVFHVTGDGGWKSYDVKLANELKNNRMSYIVLNSLKYFWSRKTPDQFADEVTPMLKDHLQKWQKKKLILMGLSFGAEVIPFLYNRLPADLQSKVVLIVMITPASTSDFTIHISDMFGAEHTYPYDVVKEVKNITLVRIIAFFGDQEKTSFPQDFKQKNYQSYIVKGGHHFSDSKTVMELIMKNIPK